MTRTMQERWAEDEVRYAPSAVSGIKGFDPGEQRDERGRWTAIGGRPTSDNPELEVATKLYSQSFTTGHKIAEESEAIIKGTKSPGTEFKADAAVLLEAIRNAEDTDMDLHRGVAFDSPFAPLENAKVGQEFNLERISSFSEERATAAIYASRRIVARFKYEIVVEGYHQSLRADPITEMGHKEHLMTGRFVVSEVRGGSRVMIPGQDVNYRKTIVLQHLGSY